MRDATDLRDALAAGALSASDAVERSLARIAAHDATLGAFAHVDAEGARARARTLDAEGPRGRSLFGVPFAVKSNQVVEGLVTDCGSRLLDGWSAPYTATCVQRLLDAGAVPVGATRMDEFGMGSSGEHACHGPTRNPWDLARTPGGSSSGSAAAVAARLVPFALGSDTGGSIRQPAALCGVTGAKPSYGRVSRYGLVAFGSSLDQVGPLTTSARDAELVLGVMAGHDPLDATSLTDPVEAPRAATLAGLRVGVPRAFAGDGVDPAVRARFDEALVAIAGAGADVVDVELADLELALPTYYVLAAAEASSNLARFDGVRYGARVEGDGSLSGMIRATRGAGFGEEVERRVLLGTYVLSSGYYDAWYAKAQRARARLARRFAEAFAKVDLLVGPTSPTTAFPLGAKLDDPVAMYRSDVATVPVSLAGLPATSVPCGLADGLPVGLQWIGPRGADAAVLAAARAFQERTEHHVAAPPAFATLAEEVWA